MGKPLSRPDCLRQSPACLGKGEDEDGYIEDCYVPQRSIYDTMRINEQIDQGAKLSQPSRSTLEKGDGGTLSSNGTVGLPAAFEAKAAAAAAASESKKLDERVIFDALKLSSDVSKSAPAPARRRPNPEKKENVNRRSWKSFMPPNFPEFAERIEASLSEVSEAGASDLSLQEKQGSAPVLAESSPPGDPGETAQEPLTLELASKPSGAPEVQEPKPLKSEAFCGPCFQDECQPLLEPEDMVVDLTTGGKRRDHQVSSATWPRAVRNTLRAGLGAARHDTLEADESDCVIEMVPLSPCLSEELLDPGMAAIVTPGLREKTESELRFEEDERLIMMEAEEEQASESSESRKAAEKRNSGLMDISEEKEPLTVLPVVGLEATESFPEDREISSHSSHWQELWGDSRLQADSSAPVPQETHRDLNAAAAPLTEEEEDDSACSAEAVTAQLEEEEFAPGSGTSASPLVADQFSDTDSVQMFLELEKLCMNEDEGDGVAPGELEAQGTSPCLEKLDAQEDSEWLHESSAEASQLLAHLEVSAADSAVVSDLEDFDATCSSQVASTTEPTVSESYSEQDTSGDSENVMFSSPPVAKGAVSQQSLSSLVSQIEEYGTELLTATELAKTYPVEGLLDFALEEAVASVGVTCCRGTLPCARVPTGGEAEEETSAVTGYGEEDASPNQDELATTPEELDSLAREMVHLEGKELPLCFEMNPSERTDFSNWDISELVSEEEVAELDKESFLYKGHINEMGGTDRESSWVSSQSDSVLEEDSEKLLKQPDSSGDLKAKEASSSCQPEPLPGRTFEGEVAMGAVLFQEETPETAGQITTVEGDILEEGDLEWLLGHGGNDEVSRGVEADGGVEGPTSLSLVLVECFCAMQSGVEDLAPSTTGEEAGVVSSLANEVAPGSLPESTDELPGPAVGPSTIAGPAAPEEPALSPLEVLDASTLGVEGSVVEATALSRNEEACVGGGLLAATWMPSAPESGSAWPSLEASVPFCLGNGPVQPQSREDLSTLEELAKAAVSISSEEFIPVAQEVEEGLATLLPGKAEDTGVTVVPPELGDSGRCVFPLAPGALGDGGHSSPQSPASTTPEEQLTSVVPEVEGPSASFLATPAAEKPPAGTDELVPDNEVFVSPGSPHADRHDIKLPPGTWEEVRSQAREDRRMQFLEHKAVCLSAPSFWLKFALSSSLGKEN